MKQSFNRFSYTKNIKEGAGVNFWMLIKANMSGKCPCRAPTKHNL